MNGGSVVRKDNVALAGVPCLVENPFAFGFTSGGNSSGTAALVANGEAEFGIGADQGGGIRIPAAHCGLVGLKEAFGLVPYTGCVSGDST